MATTPRLKPGATKSRRGRGEEEWWAGSGRKNEKPTRQNTVSRSDPDSALCHLLDTPQLRERKTNMTEPLPAPTASWLRRQMRITWHLPIALALLALAFTLTVYGKALTSSPPRVVHLRGTHAEIGYAHGCALAKEIHTLFDGYIVNGLIAREGWTLDALVAYSRHYERFISQPCIDEMHGIARGSGMPYEQILVMNTFPDALLGKRPEARSAFAVRTKKGLLVGRNLDWTNFGIAHRHVVVFILEPKEGHRVMSVGWPGIIGAITGMNDAGLTVTLNMAFANDAEPDATPFLIRLRRILDDESTIEGATKALVDQPRTFAANVLLASAKENDASVVELSGQRHAAVSMKDGLVITTNFYQSLDIDGGAGGDRSAQPQRSRAKTGEATTRGDAQRALGSVCFRGPDLGMVTNQSVVFRPAELTADIATGSVPATSGRYYTVSLK